MTDTTKLLALARAVYPDAVIESEGGVVFVYGKRHREFFDPILHDYQFVDVLAWLLSWALRESDPEKRFFTLGTWNISRMRFDEGLLEPTICWSVGHDGTESGLRAAVTEAGMRVVG